MQGKLFETKKIISAEKGYSTDQITKTGLIQAGNVRLEGIEELYYLTIFLILPTMTCICNLELMEKKKYF